MSVYEAVTQSIIEELERGAVPWVRPWTALMPYNVVSQKEYRGVNVLLLWATAFEREYRSPGWLTYRQANELGGYVKKGGDGDPRDLHDLEGSWEHGRMTEE